VRGPKIQFEHPTQIAASTFLRAVSENDAAAMWEKLSRETRGLLEGLYAARSAVAACGRVRSIDTGIAQSSAASGAVRASFDGRYCMIPFPS